MSDSLDMLLNMRQPSAGRRAGPPPAASPARSPARGASDGASFSYGGGGGGYAPSPSSASMAPYSSQRKESGYGPSLPVSRAGSASVSYERTPSSMAQHSPAASPKAYGGGAAHAQYPDTRQTYGQTQQQQQQQQPQQQPSPPPQYTEPASPVNWGAFKAVAAKQRVGSAHASQTGAAAGATNGPNSAAAGLSDAYVASQQRAAPAAAAAPAPASTGSLSSAKSSSNDSTVIGGAVIFPLKPAPRVDPSNAAASAAPSTSGGLTPIKRNPFASPSSAGGPNSSPFATATSGFTRPAPLASPNAAAASASASGAAPAGTGSDGSAVRAVQTFSCPDCGRSFKRGSLMKHQKVCKKVFKQKREQFDSAKVRTQGLVQEEDEEEEEGESDDEEGGRPRTAAAPAAAKPKKSAVAAEEHKESNWKDQSAGLREAMRRAKLEKARFGQSNAMGIDMSKMMMR